MPSLVTAAWLESPATRCVLVEFTINKITSSVIGTDTASTGTQTLYYSTHGYLTSTSDVYYQPLVVGGLAFSETLSSDSEISITYGDVELHNPNGDLDPYLDITKYIWVNGTVNIYYGDPTWISTNLTNTRSNFELIFSGVIADIDSRSNKTVNIKFRDKLDRLNVPLSETKLGSRGTWAGGQTNQDTLLPLIFGEVFNISPLYTDPATLEYQINIGTTEGVIDYRDNGVEITSNVVETAVATTGIFTLTKPLVGVLTLSAKGVKQHITFPSAVSTPVLTATYANNIAKIIALIATQYGPVSTRLTIAELDESNLYDFSIANTQPIGIYISDRENLLEVCNRIAASIGAQLYFTRQGKLQLLRYGVALGSSTETITTSDMINDSLYISRRHDLIASTKIGYGKNWTVQSNLTTAIPEQHKEVYAAEWLSKTTVDVTAQTNFKLTADPVQKDTLLIIDTDAEAEATRLTNYYSTVRTVYSFKGTSRLMLLKLGAPVTLQHPTRFDLAAGRAGQVVGLSPNWVEGTIDVEVLV